MRSVLLLALAACTVPLSPEMLTRETELEDAGPTDAYDQAARVTGVPVELLMAISHVETSMQMVEGEEEFPGQPIARGLMGLRGADLERAAELSGADVEAVATLRDENVMGAAMLLAEWADEEGIDTSDINAWAPIVARYSGIADEEAASEYVHFEVYELLRNGLEIEGAGFPAIAVSPKFKAPSRIKDARIDDNTAVWSASPNKNSRSGRKPEYIIIHTCEGSYSGCWGWLVNPSAGVSAHYVVNDSGSEVRQLVNEADRAWHISANYSSSYNAGKDSSNNGTSMNTLSVGIEHAGYSSQSSWNSGLIQRSAELACGITKRQGIPIDEYHIYGHGQMQPWSRTDPGPNWPWADYRNRIKTACGAGGSSSGGSSGGSSSGGSSSGGSSSSGATGLPSSFIIDSNNAANNTGSYRIELAGWTSSANVSGYYNTGYWWHKMESRSNSANFEFDADSAACYTVDAWWSAASDRATNATYIGYNSSDAEVGRKVVSQQINGGRWNNLGKWSFTAGTNRVALSIWGSSGVVVADAVRLTETSCN